MHGNELQFAPWLAAGLVGLMLFLRLRRQFSRQPVNPRRLYVRLALLVILAALLAPAAVSSWMRGVIALGALGAGLAGGAWALAHTKLEQAEGRVYYLPHAYAGAVVSALLIARLSMRFLHARAGSAAAIAPSQSAELASSLADPWSLALLFGLVGYYVSYNTGLLWKSQRMDIPQR
jgi:hypothetical protein